VGVFLILVARAAATVWEVKRSTSGVIGNLAKKTAYVNHYSLHIMDPDWGHLTVKMSGHPPFGAQVIANGHEWVACQAQAAGIAFTKEGSVESAVVAVTATLSTPTWISGDQQRLLQGAGRRTDIGEAVQVHMPPRDRLAQQTHAAIPSGSTSEPAVWPKVAATPKLGSSRPATHGRVLVIALPDVSIW
jgi:hypothetical protein